MKSLGHYITFNLGLTTDLEKEKLNSNLLNSAKSSFCFASYSCGGFGRYINQIFADTK